MVLTQGPAGQHQAFFLKLYLRRAQSPPPPTLLLPTEARIMSTFFSRRADSSWPSWGSFVSLFSCIPCGRRHICLGTVWLGWGYDVMHLCRRIRKTHTWYSRSDPTPCPLYSKPQAASLGRALDGCLGLSSGCAFLTLLCFSGNRSFSPSTVPSGPVPNPSSHHRALHTTPTIKRSKEKYGHC